MNIMITHFRIQDWGGLVNFSENLTRGLQELGHEVLNVMLTTSGESGWPKTKDRSLDDGWEYGPAMGLWRHQHKGWEGMYRWNYHRDLEAWQDAQLDYDLIIHQVPVPTCSKRTKGDFLWPKLFEIDTPQVVIVHDGNMQKLYPHLLEVCDKIQGIACVHDAAYNSCEVLPAPRALIHSPHVFVDSDSRYTKVADRVDRVVSLQTFKRWKHVDDFIRAIPFMDPDTEKVVCGGGIEYYYMTSKTKMKKEYLNSEGVPIWHEAEKYGLDFRGYITTEERDELLCDSKLLLDPSWSRSYAEKGSHFNRVMIEAMVCGCVPVCTDLGMANSLLFNKDEHYIEIPVGCSPAEYADILEDAMFDEGKLQEIQEANYDRAEAFSYLNTAKWIIELAEGKPTGHLGKLEIGVPTEKIKAASAKKMIHFEEDL